ncbi:hypothetical protein EG329_002963 [Mollisiaceae sp. DMI_Dod_QoI]|nr:hypothetical protein EG329_002963 [Helotiales sp. DMI_Dod_QoI]
MRIFELRKRASSNDPDEGRPLKKQRLLNSLGDTITLLVGKDEIPLTVHKTVLCDSSPFFAAACKPEWQALEVGVIRLPDDAPDTIRAMAYWIYHDEICVPKKFNHSATEETGLRESKEFLFVNLFLVGDKYLMPRLRNHAIDALLMVGAPSAIKLSGYVYENTRSGSALRALLVRLLAFQCTLDAFEAEKDHICPEFMYDIAVAGLKARVFSIGTYGPVLLPGINFCKEFHTHSEDNQRLCSVTKKFTFESA